MLGKEAFQPSLGLTIFQVKTPEELNPILSDTALQKARCSLNLLILPEIRDAILAKLRERQEGLAIIDFDPKKQRLSAIVQEILEPCLRESPRPVRLALVAPYFLIKRDGISAEMFPPGPRFEGLRLFANNYSVQGVKIKRCKPLLNHVYSILALLGPSEIKACPFLTGQDGIYLADLSFIPEKYRLDVHRAENILNRTVTQWLNAMKDLWAHP
jgi:ATP-dependent Lon protease